MSMMVTEVYQAFKAAHVDEETATAAATAIVAQLATKDDVRVLAAELRLEMAQLRAELRAALHQQTVWMVSAMVVLTGIYTGIATALKLWVR